MEISEGAYDKLFDINVKAVFFMIKECKDMLLKSKQMGGVANVLVISSLVSKHPPFPLGVYGMTKAVLNNMVYVLSKELQPEGVRVNGLAPGLVKTKFADPLF